MRFSYTAKRPDGSTYTDTYEAADKSELFSAIHAKGEILISSKEVVTNSAHDAVGKLFSFMHRIKMIDKVTFARNLGNMLEAGLSLTRAIGVMEKQTKKEKLKVVFQTLNSDISAGKTFHEALERFDKVFPRIFISMVKAGEESGNLAESLKTIAMQMEKTYQLQKKIKGAMVYPGVIITVMLLIGVIMMTTVVPRLTITFKSLKTTLPKSTQLIIWVSDMLQNHFILFILGVIALIGGGIAFGKSKTGKKVVDQVSTRIPVIGQIVIESNAAKTARTLSSLIGSGVDLLQSVRITQEVLQNNRYKLVLQETEEAVEKGKPLATVFNTHENLYPSFVAEMISVGEETGKLSSMLQGVAVFYENEVEQKTKDLSTIVEPILMVMVGAGVGFFAIAMITPMYSVMNNL
ncbi:MAG: type II secretion system F family protein [Patescibacteria group bacterium]